MVQTGREILALLYICSLKKEPLSGGDCPIAPFLKHTPR